MNVAERKQSQEAFLQAFATNAIVSTSCQYANISRTILYVWLEIDEDFSFAYNQAKEDAKDVLRAEIYKRAVTGVEEPVFQLAKLAGTVRKYSDTLLIFHSKALMAEYREKQHVEVSGPGGTPVQVASLRHLTDEELAVLERLATSAAERATHGH